MRRPKSFWEARVAELARGRSVASVAQRHGVMPGRLRWWRWRLVSASVTAIVPARMIEIVPAPYELELVDVHDFPSDAVGKAIPYGVYDVASNDGFVNVGINHDTPSSR